MGGVLEDGPGGPQSQNLFLFIKKTIGDLKDSGLLNIERKKELNNFKKYNFKEIKDLLIKCFVM